MTLKVTHSKCRCTACGDCFNSVAAPHPEEQQPAPNEQMVVAGWQFYQDGKWWNGDDRIKDHKKNTLAAGFRVRDVYATQQPAEEQPAPDMPVLAEALRQYQHNDGSGLVFGYDKFLMDRHVARLVEALELISDTDPDEGTAWFHETANNALAAYRNQGGGQ